MKTNNIHTVLSEAEVANALLCLYDDLLEYGDSLCADEIEHARPANFARAKDLIVAFLVHGKTEFTERDCLLVPEMKGSLKIVRETINFLLDICALEILDDDRDYIYEIDLSRKAIAI